MEAFLAALLLYKQVDDQMSVADVQRSLGAIYESQGRYADAFAAYEVCVETYKKLQTEHDLDRANTALGHLYLALGRPDDAEKAFKAALGAGGHDDHHAEGHATGPAPEILLGQAWLLEVRGKIDEAAAAYDKANVAANLSGQKEVAVESRVALGQIYRRQGKLANAEALLRRTREEAAKARLRPLEAAAAVALAETLLAKPDAEGARKAAVEAARARREVLGQADPGRRPRGAGPGPREARQEGRIARRLRQGGVHPRLDPREPQARARGVVHGPPRRAGPPEGGAAPPPEGRADGGGRQPRAVAQVSGRRMKPRGAMA